MKRNMFYFKIGIHIIAIMCFLFGFQALHVVMNQQPIRTLTGVIYTNIYFFGFQLARSTVADLGFLFIGIGFFIEFFMTYKPIKVLVGGKK